METRRPKSWSMDDPEGREELMARVHRAAHKVCRGQADYEDCVQDMVLTILECQAEDPDFARQAPSFQVKRAYWRAKDKRRRDDRENRHLHLDAPVTGDSTTEWHELLEGSGPADEEVFLNLTRADVRQAIVELAVDDTEDDQRGAMRRDIIVRRFYGEQTVAGAARALGIPKGTGCMYSAQALKQLRERLGVWQ